MGESGCSQVLLQPLAPPPPRRNENRSRPLGLRQGGWGAQCGKVGHGVGRVPLSAPPPDHTLCEDRKGSQTVCMRL